MHARSLQGFGYGDAVHQFKKRCKLLALWSDNSFGLEITLIPSKFHGKL
ncbi:MAG: hypothetical protein O4965_00445 [Trichodesmium sp. St19_bin1]|nr:hypothetical protein [Trichodesmium sp. St19_bin1]